MTKLPRLTQRALHNTRVSWIPAASLLPTVALHDDERLKIRRQYVSDGEALPVYYGFVAPPKGIEVLLEIVAKTKARLLMACDFQRGDNYHRSLLNQIRAKGIPESFYGTCWGLAGRLLSLAPGGLGVHYLGEKLIYKRD